MVSFQNNLNDLRSKLVKNQHALIEPDDADSTNVFPPPGEIVTIATDIDGVLRPQYRGNYFVCMHNDESDLSFSPSRIDLANQSLRQMFKLFPQTSAFVNGPIRWLLFQFERFVRILVWPMSSRRLSGGEWLFQDWELDESKLIRKKITDMLSHGYPTGAMEIDLHEFCASLSA